MLNLGRRLSDIAATIFTAWVHRNILTPVVLCPSSVRLGVNFSFFGTVPVFEFLGLFGLWDALCSEGHIISVVVECTTVTLEQQATLDGWGLSRVEVDEESLTSLQHSTVFWTTQDGLSSDVVETNECRTSCLTTPEVPVTLDACLLPGWAASWPRTRKDFPSVVLTSDRVYRRHLVASEIEQLFGYVPGFAECLVECANPSSNSAKVLMMFADLDTIGSVRVKMLLSGAHATVVERVCRAVLPPEIFDPCCNTNVKLDPTWASGRLKSVVDEARAECPFLVHRSSEGCHLTSPLGPDQAEQHLHRISAGVQTKHQSQLVGGRLVVCLLISMTCVLLRFLRCCLPILPSQKTWALQFVFASGTSGVVDRKGVARWRRRRLRKFKQVVGCGADLLEDIFRPTVGVSVKSLKTDFHLERIAVAAASLGWPDHDFPLLFSTGAQLLGTLPEAHIYRRANVVQSVSLDELLTDANQYVPHFRAGPSPKPGQAEPVWNKTMEEVELGYMAGLFPAEVVDKLWELGVPLFKAFKM